MPTELEKWLKTVTGGDMGLTRPYWTQGWCPVDFSLIFQRTSIFLFFLKILKKYDLTRPKLPKLSLTSWPEVIVIFHGEYKRTVTSDLNLSHYHTSCTTASGIHRVELKWTHFREVEVRGAQLDRVDEYCHRRTCIVSTRWGVPLLKRESWKIISIPMHPNFNDEGSVPVVPRALVKICWVEHIDCQSSVISYNYVQYDDCVLITNIHLALSICELLINLVVVLHWSIIFHWYEYVFQYGWKLRICDFNIGVACYSEYYK